MKRRVLLLLLSFLFINHLSSQNLLTNGDFETGGSGVGFNINGAGYTLLTAPFTGTTLSGDYAFTTNPQPLNTALFIAGGDHTTGTGNMMVIDGNTNTTSPRFWRAGDTGGGVCGLTVGATYRFSYWIKSVSTAVTNAATQANIAVQFTNVASSSLFAGNAVAPLPAAGWQKVTYTFVPNNTCVLIELSNSNLNTLGNDFAVDDFVVSTPLTTTYSTVAPSCTGVSDGSIVVYASGGVSPYLTYSIAGPVAQTNTTGIFTGLGNGTYTISVTDSSGTTTTQAGAIISSAAVNPLVTTFNSTTCVGNPITLTVSGGTTYAWTSSPVDPTLTTPTSNSITVTPTVITNYTVSSPVTLNRNLVFNGNFTNANFGFTSNYNYLATSTAGGTPGTYGTVTNPNAWSSSFAACGDHTTGGGRMLVVEGSTANAGNDKVWSQTIPVTPGLNYTFSYWIQALTSTNPASIETLINGSSIGIGSAPSVITCGNWTQYTYTWNSGVATTAVISLFDRNVMAVGNDFAIDDITFTVTTSCVFSKTIVVTPVSPPTATISGSSNICPGTTAILTFNGTPNASVLFTDNVTGVFYTVVLNSSGTATYTTNPINFTTTFSLVSVNSSPPGCNNTTVVGSAILTINQNGCAGVLTGGVAVGAIVAPICNLGECRTLTSSFVDLGTTTTYTVEPILYCPQAAFNDPNYIQFPLNADDSYSPVFTLPFNFCFYGNLFSTVQIGDNGVIKFGSSYIPNAFGQNTYVHNTTPLSALNFPAGAPPNGGADNPFRNMILGVYQDTNTGTSVAPAIKSVNYSIVGTYPCRKLVVNFSNLAQFSCGTSVGLQTSQIVLYEISNIIEVYVQNRTPCTNWQSGRGTIGIKGGGATPPSLAAPGRDSAPFTATNEAWRFKPSGPSAVTFQWLQGTTPLGTTSSINVCPTTTTTYTAEATYNNCGVNTVVTKDVTVTVYPDLTNAPQNISQCTNTFDLTTNNSVILGTLNPFDYNISYHTNLADAQNVASPISPANAFISNGQTIYVSILGPGSCINVKQFDLIVTTCFVCETITNPSADQTLCIDGDPTPFTVNTGYTDTNSISYVYFNALQTGTNMYSGGTLLGNVTPVSTVATYNAGVLGTPGSLPNVAGTYYVYAIANPLPADPTCRPFQLITVVVNEQFSAGSNGSAVTICETSTATINLFDLINGEDVGGTWSQTTGAGGVFDAAAGTFTPAVGASSSTFTYSVASISPCVNTSSVATVNINPQPIAGTSGDITICDSNSAVIDLFSIITGEETGGTWTQVTGTGGVFDAAAGTFTPAAGTTTSTFDYTLIGTAPCTNSVSTATININPQPDAGTSGNITICDSSTTIIDLFSLITGEQTGGTWTQISGTGGTFDAIAGTYAVAPGATTGTFDYSFVGTTPCINSVSTATININPQPNAGLDGGITICDSNLALIDLFSLISGEQIGGSWSQTSGTGGVFDAITGTFTPAAGATTSTFTYTLNGTAPCPNDSSIATVTINPQPNAGTDGSTLVCDSSTAPIDLFSLITGEDVGGVWTQTGGSGGTFNAVAGTYTPALGATTGVFVYTLSALSPCIADSSTATVNINSQPNAGVDGGTTVCETSTVAILLSDLITGEQTGGVWTQTGGTGGTFDPVAGTFTLAVGATTSTFQYTITGVAPCIDDFSIATVTINAQPNAGVDGGTTVCETDITAIDLFSLITGEQAGGVWTRTSGTGGTFIAAAGTFTPAIGATSSTFVYTLPGVAPCAADTSIATVTINRQPNAGVDGATNVCESSTDPINLFSLIAGEQPGGVWTQTSGTGGTFDGATGTFTPGFGATTSTFTYTIAGIAPCIDDASVVTITFVTAPAINQPTPFIVCDDSLNNDGIYCFDLTTKDAEITTDPTVDITYHYTQTDALTGANPLPNPFCNNDPSFQTIYVRVFDPLAPQCPSTTTLDLIINPLPIANPVITDYVLCDVNNSPDGMEQFDLSTKDLEIANGQTGVVVTYYLTQQDAIDQVTPSLPTLYTNATPNQQQIWINIAYTATGCNSVSSFNLIVNPLPLSTQPGYPQYELCDYDTAQIGFEQFDLSTQVTPVLLGQNGMSVGFYPTLTDAQDDTNEITNLLYTNVQQFVQTLGIRITNDATGCYVISTMDLVVNPLPILVQPTQPYVVCDTDQDGQSSSFDLNTLTPIIDPSSSYTINYYLTIEDANSDTNPIDLTVPFTNNVTIQFLYVRGEDANGCYSVIQIELDVNPAPIIPTTLPNLVECDDDANTQNGITAFDLTQQTAVILAAQTGPASDYTVNYYTSLADANVPQNAIIQTTNYQGTNGQTIWVVVRNLTTTCPSIGSFQLVVNTPIVLTTPTLYKVCDDDAIPNNLFTTFDLVSFIGTIPGHTITFYLDSAHTQLITTPGAFENNVPANQTIFLVATNDTTGCISTRTLTLSVLRVPTPNDNPPTSPAFIMCEDPANPGMATFDITQNAAFIANNDPNVTLHYYYNQTDLANHANEITNPTSVLLGDPALLAVTPTPINLEQYVYIAVTFNTPPAPTDSNNFACYKEVRQGFIVNPLPIVGLLGNGNQYQICEEDPILNDGMEEFDLTSQIGALLAGNSTTPASTYDVAFYTSNPPSAATQIQNPSAYTNTTANSQTIYVVVTNTTTGCESGVGQFNIVVNPKPEATAPDDFETCDTDGTNDGLYLYPLTALEATILGATQLPADYEVTFYDTTLADAEADLNAIADEANYMASTHTIWVRVTNNVTECYKIVSFEIVVERLPEPVIVSDNGGHILCVDFLTNQVARPLLLTATNTVPGTFTYQWFVDGVALPGETNQTYQVPAVAGGATRNYTVVMTSTSGAVTPACDELSDPFEVIQSGQAAIISGVGYTVTNAFTNNQVITVTGIDGYGTYAYSLDDGPIQTSPIFENVSLGDHTIYVWDTTDPNYSCDRLPIFNVQTIDYPHYFTPNGDGFHDTWNIVGLSSYPNTKIYIFDRYGKLLKQISASGDGWDGTFNGQLLPATDYWFTVEFQESSISQAFKQFKAHFSLKR